MTTRVRTPGENGKSTGHRSRPPVARPTDTSRRLDECIPLPPAFGPIRTHTTAAVTRPVQTEENPCYRS